MKIAILGVVISACVLGVTSFPQQRQTGCSTFCPLYIVQFCGSDGKTYNSNECFIKSQWCSQGRNDFESFSTLHMGPCTGDELTGATTAP